MIVYEKNNKLVEKYDDNPGSYFGMLVEGLNEEFDEVYASVMRQASKDARQLRDAWEKEGKALSSTLSSLGYIRDDPRSVYMYKESDGGNAIVFNLEPIEDFKNYVEYFVVDENNRIPRGWTKTRLVIDFWKDNDTEADSYEYDESLKEDKFVSRDKMSKKDRKELDSQKRGTWGNTNPVTRVQPNKKAYDRKRDKKIEDESLEESKLNESIVDTKLDDETRERLKEAATALQYEVDDLFDIINDTDSTFNDLFDVIYKLKNINEYLEVVKDKRW